MKRHYLLTIDGPLLRNQRQLLLKLLDAACRKTAFRFEGDNDRALLAGLAAMLDEIADRAHDRFGIDCLLETTDEEADQTADGDRCDCEKPGFFCSGVPGILAHVENRSSGIVEHRGGALRSLQATTLPTKPPAKSSASAESSISERVCYLILCLRRTLDTAFGFSLPSNSNPRSQSVSTLVDEPLCLTQLGPAENLRATMAAARVSHEMVGGSQNPHAGTKGRGRRTPSGPRRHSCRRAKNCSTPTIRRSRP